MVLLADHRRLVVGLKHPVVLAGQGHTAATARSSRNLLGQAQIANAPPDQARIQALG